MQVLCRKNKDSVLARLSGELDHHTAPQARKKLEEALKDPSVLALTVDLSELTFMDSSGIGVLLGRYKTLCGRGGALFVKDPQPQVERVMRTSGLYSVVKRA